MLTFLKKKKKKLIIIIKLNSKLNGFFIDLYSIFFKKKFQLKLDFFKKEKLKSGLFGVQYW